MTQLSRDEAESLARAGAAALQAGRAAEARQNFDMLVAAGQVNVQIWLLLAYACASSATPTARRSRPTRC